MTPAKWYHRPGVMDPSGVLMTLCTVPSDEVKWRNPALFTQSEYVRVKAPVPSLFWTTGIHTLSKASTLNDSSSVSVLRMSRLALLATSTKPPNWNLIELPAG